MRRAGAGPPRRHASRRNLETALRLWNRKGCGTLRDARRRHGDGGRHPHRRRAGRCTEAADGEDAAADAGVLARRREIRELSREIGELRERQRRLLEEEEAVRRDRAALEERRAETFRAREDAANAHAAAAKAKAVIEETLSQARAQLDERTQEEAFLRGSWGGWPTSWPPPSTPPGRPGRRGGRRRSVPAPCSRTWKRRGGSWRSAGSAPTRPRSPTTRSRSRTARRRRCWPPWGAGGREGAPARGARPQEDRVRGIAGVPRRRDAGRQGSDRAGGDGAVRAPGPDRRPPGRPGRGRIPPGGDRGPAPGARGRESGAVERQAAERLRLQKVEMDIAAVDALLHQRYEVRLADLPPSSRRPATAGKGTSPSLEASAEACGSG